ncbi:MAG: hypothetical protein ACSHYF_16030 [Verrucomicrobiaceae bacterium]
MNDQSDDLDTLLDAAEARERIRQRSKKRKIDGTLLVIVIVAGIIVASAEAVNLGGYLNYLIWSLYWIAFAFYTRFLSLPRNFEEDGVFFTESKRPLGLWNQFARQDRLPELIFVLLIPHLGTLAHALFY